MPLLSPAPPVLRLRSTPPIRRRWRRQRPPRANGQASRRPHSNARVAQVRRLIEQTTLTYGEIATHAGRPRLDLPLDARLRLAAAGLRAGRDRHHPAAARLAEAQAAHAGRAPARARRTACARTGGKRRASMSSALVAALQVLKMARLEAMGRRRRRRFEGETLTGAQWQSRRTRSARRSRKCAAAASISTARPRRRSIWCSTRGRRRRITRRCIGGGGGGGR